MDEQLYRGYVCDGCGKHITGLGHPPSTCQDCGGRFIDATPDRLACDRCGEEDASRVLGPTDHSRLCDQCIQAVNKMSPTVEENDNGT